MATPEPMILIKKADGTTERVPLSSVRDRKTDSGAQSVVEEKSEMQKTESGIDSGLQTSDAGMRSLEDDTKEIPVKESNTDSGLQTSGTSLAELAKKTKDEVHEEEKEDVVGEKTPETQDLPVAATPHELAMTTPVDDFFVDLAKAKEWNTHDHISPLEESLGEVEESHTEKPPIPESRFEDVSKIIKTLSFDIPKDLHARLHSLIQSRVKDIRSDHQLITYAVRAVESGGLGLSEAQAKTLVDTIHTVLAVQKETPIPGPNRTVIDTPPVSKRVQSTRSSTGDRNEQIPPAKNATVSLKDIHPPEKRDQAMGPIDEIETMTLHHFRSLSADPHTAIDILQQKVDTLRDESYFEYIKARDAWHNSPLYGVYLAHLDKSLDTNKQLRDVLDGDMGEEDIAVIASFTERLRF